MTENGKPKPPDTPRAERSKAEERRQRQARALRENLKKRRAQARDRRRDEAS